MRSAYAIGITVLCAFVISILAALIGMMVYRWYRRRHHGYIYVENIGAHISQFERSRPGYTISNANQLRDPSVTNVEIDENLQLEENF
jgi:hypothetical protein